MVFSLRLNDTEAEALNRLAAIEGLSKNKLIVSLIVNRYGQYDGQIINDRLYNISGSLYEMAMSWETVIGDPDVEYSKYKEALKIVEAAIEEEENLHGQDAASVYELIELRNFILERM